jgi:hypothetical protein
MKQTAVDFLHSKILFNIGLDDNDIITLRNIVEECKIKEREQIRSAYLDGQDDIFEHCKCKFNIEYHLNSLDYYKKKYTNEDLQIKNY